MIHVLLTDVKSIVVNGVDTDVSPFDPGSYASSRAYTTGNAVRIAAEKLLEKMYDRAIELIKKIWEKKIP